MASVTHVYARAFAEVVWDQRLEVGPVLRELGSLAQLLAANRQLREVWEAPSIPGEQKLRLLDAIAAHQALSRPVRNFLAVLLAHRRIQFLPAIVKQCEHELNERLGFAEAEITSARELSEAERHELEAEVEKLTGKRVRARYRREASLLGGALVKVGSTIYDGSVKAQLQRIREQLANA
jgi:F-type H+-transporting ATPase subunit delta